MSAPRRFGAHPHLYAAMLLFSCPIYDADPPDAAQPRDAGRDAPSMDTGADARDGSADTSRDVTMADRSDGGPTDPGWVPLPGLPGGCVVERAEHPERVGGLSWSECGAGCLRALLPPARASVGFGNATFRDGEGWIGVTSITDEPTKNVYAMMRADGVPFAAWRFPHNGLCRAAFGAWGGGRAGVVVNWHDADATNDEDRIYIAPIAELGALTEPTAIIGAPHVGFRRFVQRLTVASDVAAVEIAFSGIILAIGTGGETTVVSAGASTSAEGDHLVWERIDSLHLEHFTPDGGATNYFDSPSPSTAYVGMPFVDRGTLVWAYDPFDSGQPAELWTSPFARTSAGLVPRLVRRDVPRAYDVVYGDGVYVAVRDGGAPTFSADIIDVADGRLRRLGNPDGVGCNYVLYASPTEVLIQCTINGTSPAQTVLYRIDPRTLPYEA